MDMKRIRSLLLGAGILLSQIMCAHVAWNWCALKYAARYEGGSAPGYAALLWALPYLAGVGLCGLLGRKR